MSQDKRLNEVEDLLRSLVPAPLAVDRDRLLFEAGMAAARRSRGGRFIWPAIAASLLVACGGLTVALQKKSIALDAALAAAGSRSVEAIASDAAPADEQIAPDQPGEPTRVAAGGSFGSRWPSRELEQILSRSPSSGGQLTAHGWVDGPPRHEKFEADEPAAEPRVRTLRSQDYLEQLRSLGG